MKKLHNYRECLKIASKEVFSKSQLAVNELRNKLSQLRTRESGEIIQMITKLACYILEIQQQQGYIEISDIVVHELDEC